MVEPDVADCRPPTVAEDPVWSQTQETVRMLDLAAGQVAAAMRDSNASVAVLTDAFTSMAGTLETIEAALAALPPAAREAVAGAGLHANTREVVNTVQQSIVAFQFYDRLVQRLSHVGQSLAALSELVGDPCRVVRPGEWRALQETVRAMCTMNEERDMFGAIMGGATVAEALARHLENNAADMGSSGGDIELF